MVIEFEANRTTYIETITFSLPNISISGDPASGSGSVKTGMEPGGTAEGTFEYEATKI